MSNAHSLKGQKALEAFTQATYDLENLEPEIGELLGKGGGATVEIILTQCMNLQRVLLKMNAHTRNAMKGDKHHGR